MRQIKTFTEDNKNQHEHCDYSFYSCFNNKNSSSICKKLNVAVEFKAWLHGQMEKKMKKELLFSFSYR